MIFFWILQSLLEENLFLKMAYKSFIYTVNVRLNNAYFKECILFKFLCRYFYPNCQGWLKYV